MKKFGTLMESKVASNKRLYDQPILKIYGSVKTLTADGTGTKLEQDPPGSEGCSQSKTKEKNCP
jgi:hypothetical protein